MQRHVRAPVVLAASLFAVFSIAAQGEEFTARLSGFNEIGALNSTTQTGALLSTGSAKVKVSLDRNAKTATYTVTYSGLSNGVTQGHIHFGKNHVPGGVIVFFCSNLGNGPAGTPACPANAGTVTGTWTAASVVGPAAQNIAAGDFDGLVAALTSNTAYANLHTAKFPAGEIRGQMQRAEREDDDD